MTAAPAATTPSPKKSKLPIIIAAAAAVVVVIVAVMIFAGVGGGKTTAVNPPDGAKTAMQDASKLAGDLAVRYASYEKNADGSSTEGRTYDVASAEIQDGLDRVQADLKDLEAAGTSWGAYEQADKAMRNLQGALQYEKDILEAQHNATLAGSRNGGTTSEAFEKLMEGYSKIEPPDYLSHYVESTVGKLPTILAALKYNAGTAPSTLSQFTGTELTDWWLKKQSTYDAEGISIMVKQCEESRDMLDGLAGGTAKNGKPTAEIEAIDTIAPNLYPSLDAAAIVNATAYDDKQSVTVSADIAGFTQKFEQKYDLAQGYNRLLVKPALLPTQDMTNLSTNSTTQLNVKVVDDTTGDVIVQVSQPVNLLSMYDFAWTNDEFGCTAAFDLLAWLRPQAQEVTDINRKAADILGKWTNGQRTTIAGYQYGTDVIATLLQVAAIQKAISDSGVVYIMDPYSYSSDQYVLTPDQVVQQKRGLCIETSLLMASCLMSANMHPIIILTPGHAQIAVETYSGSGNYFLIETTTLPYNGINTSLDSTNPGFYNGLLASAKTKDGSIHYWTTTGSSDEWKQYLSYKADGSDEYSGVFVVDCNLQRLLEIQGIENM